MFKGRRVILEWGVDIGHSGVTSIACIREKAQIRQFKPLDHFAFFAKKRLICFLLYRRMGKHESEE